jgi:hypothetical protein
LRSQTETLSHPFSGFNWKAIEVEMTTLHGSRLLLSIAAFCAFGAGAVSAGNPLERHLAIGHTPTFQSGDTVPQEGVFEIALKPVADVVYLMRSDDTVLTNNGGLVTVENVPPGRYAILLSQKARLEVVQLQPFAPIPMILGDTESDLGLATISAKGGPLTLQLSGVAAPSITVAVVPLSDQRMMRSE